jgi:hypothetical protein
MSAKITEAKTDDEKRPCGSCLVTEEAFTAMRSDVTEILVCLKGSPQFGHRGLVDRVATNESHVVALQAEASSAKTAVRVVGLISVGLASAISFAASVWPKSK